MDLRQFFFLEARSTHNDKKALELLAKQYHNTKWMGCTLRVESARPHFLQRLQEERAERSSKQLQMNNVAKEVTDDTKLLKKPPRRLRIRKQYGQEAYHVDTHPQTLVVSSNDWGEFTSLHQRLNHKFSMHHEKLIQRRKEERKRWILDKHSSKERMGGGGELQSCMFLNRGIHVRFEDSSREMKIGEEESSVESKGLGLEENGNNINISSELMEPVQSDVNGSEIEGANHASINQDCTEEKADLIDEEKSSPELEEGVSSNADDAQSVESPVSTDEDDIVPNPSNKENRYIWSDDESGGSHSSINNEELSDEESEDSHPSIKKGSFQATNVNMLDEFSGMDFHNNDVEMSIPYESDGNDTPINHEETSLSLEDDIHFNIGILSQLFPRENIRRTPVTVGTDAIKVESVGKNKQSSTLIVQRYDPTKDDAIQMDMNETDEADKSTVEVELKVENTIDAANSENSATVYDEKEISHKTNHSNSTEDRTYETKVNEPEKLHPTQNESDTAVYEQDKLENIFKQAREQKQSNGFSFGAMFESQQSVDATTGKLTDGSKADGFSFGQMFEKQFFSETTSRPVKNDIQQHDFEPKHLPTKSRRIGLRFSARELDRYESLFFTLNEGSRIIDDMESMKNEEHDQEMRQKEREALTLDWKRKHKSALSRKVKKRRF